MAIISGIGGAGITPDPELSVTAPGALQIGSTGNQGTVVLFGASTGSVQVNSASLGGALDINAGYATPAPSTVTGAAATITTSTPSLIINASVSINLTLPTASSYSGFVFKLKNIAAQSVNSATANIVLLSGGGAVTTIITSTAGKWAELQSDGTNWQIMASN